MEAMAENRRKDIAEANRLADLETEAALINAAVSVPEFKHSLSNDEMWDMLRAEIEKTVRPTSPR